MNGTNRDACLRLVLPRSLEEKVIDLLLEHPEWVGSFTAYGVDGHGSPHAIASSAEQVRGRAGRVQIEILLAAEHAHELVDCLRGELPDTDIAWWVGPVVAAGDFR